MASSLGRLRHGSLIGTEAVSSDSLNVAPRGAASAKKMRGSNSCRIHEHVLMNGLYDVTFKLGETGFFVECNKVIRISTYSH
jgi:hypothetical protein